MLKRLSFLTFWRLKPTHSIRRVIWALLEDEGSERYFLPLCRRAMAALRSPFCYPCIFRISSGHRTSYAEFLFSLSRQIFFHSWVVWLHRCTQFFLGNSCVKYWHKDKRIILNTMQMLQVSKPLKNKIWR